MARYKKLPFNVSQVMVILLALVATGLSHPKDLNFVDIIGREIQKEVVAAKVPIVETVVSVGSSQCSKVKRILGVEYDQYKEDDEPKLNRLTLNYISSSIKIVYNLTDAARLIPESRNFDPKKKLIVYMHGFIEDPRWGSFQNISSAFLAIGDYNIVALDASSLIRWLYLRSSTYIRFIGTKLGETLAAMIENPKGIHLIGHSLGSHISSFAGKRVLELTGHKVGRISGLDPAGPCFSDINPELRLTASDAEFVDVMHTDGGVYGLKDPVGHVDFYPNAGSQQPNCLLQTCSHNRAWLYYAESVVTPNSFLAVECADWDAFKQGKCGKELKIMGYACDPTTRGNYYLQTGEDPPYGLGEKGASYVNNEGFIKNIGALRPSLSKQ